MDSQVKGQTVKAETNANVDFTTPGYVASFYYRNQHAAVQSSSWFTMRFANGDSVKLDPTQFSAHNRVRLYSTIGANTDPTPDFFTAADQTWYRVAIKVDLVNHNVYAEVRDANNGNLLGTSTTLSVSPNANQVRLVSFEGLYTGSNPIEQAPFPMNFDTFRLATADPPNAPSLSATAGPNPGQISVSWQPPSEDGGLPVQYYLLYRGNTSGTATTLIANTTGLSYSDTGLGNGVTKYYVVKAANLAGVGPGSNEASAKTYDYPTAPQSLTAAPGSSVGQIRLTWQPPANVGGTPVTNYTIYRGATPGSETLLTQVGSVLSYADSNRPNGTSWSYKVAAVNLVGQGPQSASATSQPRPDEASAATGITVSPTTGWTGDARTASFTYTVAASQCDPSQTCPVDHDWRIYQDGSANALDGMLLASGTNTHSGHAETTTYPMSVMIHPSGSDGAHLLKVAVNARSGSTQWNLSSKAFQLDAPLPGNLVGPSRPVTNQSTTTGNQVLQVTSNYTVFQKQCRQTDSCPIQNDWKILLDGSPASADGTQLDQGSNLHSAHGDSITYAIDRSVNIPALSPGPHFIKVAARADANSPWQVSASLLSGDLFSPLLDDPAYVKTAGQAAYSVNNTGHDPIWIEGQAIDLPTVGHSGSLVWGTTLTDNYPSLSNGTLTLKDLDLSAAAHASLDLNTYYATGDDYDAAQVYVVVNGNPTLLEPATGPSYTTLVDGARGWAGDSNGWQSASFDLTPYLGNVVNIQFRFRSDAVDEARGWFVDDIFVQKDATLLLNDSMESLWQKTGGWTLTQPSTGPGQGKTSVNAWSLAPHAEYNASTTSILHLPILSLVGVPSATLTFQQWFKTEYGNDSAHVEISPDNGTTWITIAPYAGVQYDHLPDGSVGWSGNSLGWVSATFELTPYAGSDLNLRLVFTSDDAMESDGWYVSDFSLVAYPPPAPSLSPYANYAKPGDAFFAYFENAGTTASVTTPSGQTTSIRYVGTSGDVVARLDASGTLTARKALVLGGSPTSVPSTDFVVTGPGFNNTPNAGTWIIRGAPTLTGVGGTQLAVGGKVFDDVLVISEAIETTGNGKRSASNRPVLQWNWHDQATPRYDTGLSSQTSNEETVADARFRYDIDADQDGFSLKAEVRYHGDPTNPASTPYSDDDNDGIPNILETSRNAALDALQTTLSPYYHAPPTNVDWEHTALGQAGLVVNETAVLGDYDNDTIPDYRDAANLDSEALLRVGSNPATNLVQLATSRSGFQIAVIIAPDWQHVVLVELGAPLPDAGPVSITYDQFFAELGAYYTSARLNAYGQADEVLNTTLRQHLDETMSYTLVRRTIPVGELSSIPLSSLSGTPADGTWTIVRDTDIPTLQLNINGNTINADVPSATLPPLGILRANWHFLNVHNSLRGYEDVSQCVTYTILLADGACSTFPGAQGMRLYGLDAEARMRGLLTQLRVVYNQASLSPQVSDFTQQIARATGLNESFADPAWYGLPTADIVFNATQTLTIPEGALATGDYGAANPRVFDWELRFAPTDPRATGQPSLALGIEPTDASSGPSTILVRGSTLAALGFDVGNVTPVSFDDDHAVGSSATWTDADGDGVKDYVLTISHFSKAWAYWTTVNGPATGNDLSVVGPWRAFMTPGYPTAYVWDGSRWQAVAGFPSELNNGHFQATALHATGTNEAYIVGGNACDGSSGLGWLVRLTYDPNSPQGVGYGGRSKLEKVASTSTSGCGIFYAVDALSSSNVWIAGAKGIYQWTGSSLVQKGPAASHIQFFDQNTGIAVAAGSSTILKLQPNGNWAATGPNLPFVPSSFPGGFQMSADRSILWATGGGNAAYCRIPCSSWTSVNYGANHDGIAIYGHDANDAWSAGKVASSGAPSLYWRGGGGWSNQMQNWNFGQASGQFQAIGFNGKNEGWLMERNGALYHYTASNSPPVARFNMDRTSATTNDVVNVDASGSYDPDGDAISYSWNWGDGTAGSSSMTASHRYGDTGWYTITLTVTDSQGAISSTSKSVNVAYHALSSGVPFSQSFSASAQQDYYKIDVPSGQDLLRVSLSGPSGTDFDVYARYGAKPTTSAYDMKSTGPSSSESMTRSNPNPGSWIIMVRSNYGTGTYTITATVIAKPTVPTINQNPNPQRPGQSFTLSGSSTGASSLYYTIDWGDGTAQTRVPSFGTLSSGAPYSATHAYGVIGNYAVTVTATDQYGLSRSGTFMAQVRDVPAGSTNPAASVAQTSATLSGSLSSLGGYSSVDTWFEYGTTTSYGQSTPTVARSATGSFTASLSGLARSTVYHYRLAMRDAMGTAYGGDRVFQTVDNAPGMPTMTVSSSTSAPGELVWVNGSSVDPEGDNFYVTVDWQDGTTTRYPTSGTMPSGSTYSVSHAYSSYGSFGIRATATDAFGASSTANVRYHDVVALPTASILPPGEIARTSASLNANLTGLGGDPNGVLARFEYGPQGGGYPNNTPWVKYTGTQTASVRVSGLVEGGAYQYRFVATNARGSATTSTQTFATNARPVLRVLDMVPEKAYSDTTVSFVVQYADKDNNPPGNGYPQVLIDGVPTTLTRVNGGTDYVRGVTYSLDTQLSAGAHTYAYRWSDNLPDVQTTPGRTSTVEVYRPVSWYDPINHDATSNGLPSSQWARSSSNSGPRWHTVNTPRASGIADAPDSGNPPSVSLWFGDDSTGTYANNPNQRAYGSVLTPWVDLSQVEHPAVSFWSYFETQDNGTTRDTKKVYVVDQQNRETLAATLFGPYHGNHLWSPVAFSLAPWAGQQVRIRFEFDTVDGEANNYRGWYINEIMVGTDRDSDAIPEFTERGMMGFTTWPSLDAPGSFAPGQSRTGHQWGVQYSFTDTVASEVYFEGGSGCQATVRLNTTTWSTTMLSGACPASPFRLQTNLVQAGLRLRELDTPQNLTLTVTNTGSSTLKVSGFFVTAGGRLQSAIRDSDGDGLSDGVELSVTGTNALSRDPDNDGFNDGVDHRPYTPDDPPAIDLLDPGPTADWLKGARVHVSSRHGVQDVRLFFTGPSGTTELTSYTKPDSETWVWSFPQNLGRVQSIRVVANNSYHVAMEMIVTYSTTQPEPKSMLTNIIEWTERGSIFVVAAVGAAAAVAPGATGIGAVVAPEVVAGVAVGVVLIAAGAYVVHEIQKPANGGVTTVSKTYRYPTPLIQEYGIPTGSLGCVNKLRLYEGEASKYVHRGAKGIQDMHRSAYASPSAVAQRIAGKLSQANFVQLDPFTGVMLYVDPTLKVVDRWQIQIDPTSCMGEIVDQNRRSTGNIDPNVIKAIIIGTGAVALWALLHHVAPDEGPDGEQQVNATVHLIDAKAGYAEVETLSVGIPDEFWMAFERWMCHGVVPFVADRICGTDDIEAVAGEFGIQVAAIVNAAARESASRERISFQPTWYWWNASRSSMRGDVDVSTVPLDIRGGVFLAEDGSQGMDAYNDLGSSHALNSFWQFARPPSVAQLMPQAESNVCAWEAAHPATRYAYLPMAIQRSSPNHIYVEIADSKSLFGYGGGC